MTATGAAKSGASGSGTSVTNERKPVSEQDGGGDTATATTIATVTGTGITGNHRRLLRAAEKNPCHN